MDNHMNIIRFYLAGKNPGKMRPVEKFRSFLSLNAMSQYKIEIIDILEKPFAAEIDKVFVTPTIVLVLPTESKKIVGDISDPEKNAALLGLLQNH